MNSRLIASMMDIFKYHTLIRDGDDAITLRIEITKDYCDSRYEMCVTIDNGTYFQVVYEPTDETDETDEINPILKHANYTVCILENNTNIFHTLKFGQTESGILWQNINKT